MGLHMAYAEHHARFMDDCAENEVCPKGLKLKKRNQCTSTGIRPVKDRIQEILRDAEKALMEVIHHDYLDVLDHLRNVYTTKERELKSIKDIEHDEILGTIQEEMKNL